MTSICGGPCPLHSRSRVANGARLPESLVLCFFPVGLTEGGAKIKKVKTSKSVPAVGHDKAAEEKAFGEILELIQAARARSLAAVNTALIDLYWQIGQSISRRIDAEGWGKNTVAALAHHIQQEHPNLQGFSAQN